MKCPVCDTAFYCDCSDGYLRHWAKEDTFGKARDPLLTKVEEYIDSRNDFKNAVKWILKEERKENK